MSVLEVAGKSRGDLCPNRLGARSALAAMGAACHWASFPPFESPLAAWMAPLCWILALDGVASGRWRFRLIFFAALAGVAGSLGWLWALFKAGSIFLWGLLAIYFGLWGATLGAANRFPRRIAWAWPAIAWTGVEYFRGEMAPLCFSWLALGYSQQNAFGWALAPVVGVYGIGFAIVLWASSWVALWRLENKSRAVWMTLAALSLMPALSLLPRPAWQGSEIGGTVWLQQTMDGPSELSPTAPEGPAPIADLIVWPEYSIFDDPFDNRAASWFLEEAKRAAAKSRRGLIFGAQDNILSPSGQPRPGDYFNTAYWLNPQGEMAGSAVKNQPVQLIRDGRPAKDVAVLEIPAPADDPRGQTWRVGLGVCYDGSYQRFSRRMVARGANLLCFPTFNKSDWGSIQHRQHQRLFQMRAMEHRLPVVAAANSGPTFTAWPNGAVATELPFGRSAGFIAPVAWIPAQGPTLFVRGGWRIGPACVLLLALGLMGAAGAGLLRPEEVLSA
jgi:apolipoprotein N-acyltransferase